jgi:hypothetical protein
MANLVIRMYSSIGSATNPHEEIIGAYIKYLLKGSE